MDLTGKTLWQVGTGDGERSYGDICLQFDVMIAGPGEWRRLEEAAYAYAPIPAAGVALDATELARRLFIEGLPSEQIDKLTATLASLQRLASWYCDPTKRPAGRPSKQETVCYLVIPLLQSLGWSQQTAAVQWNYVDLALFRGMPPSDATLDCVFEVKPLEKSVFCPFGQARDYARRTGRETCDRLIVTDGIRYALHRRSGNDFNLEAYLNILRMRDSYSIHGCAGAVQAVLGMSCSRGTP